MNAAGCSQDHFGRFTGSKAGILLHEPRVGFYGGPFIAVRKQDNILFGLHGIASVVHRFQLHPVLTRGQRGQLFPQSRLLTGFEASFGYRLMDGVVLLQRVNPVGSFSRHIVPIQVLGCNNDLFPAAFFPPVSHLQR